MLHGYNSVVENMRIRLTLPFFLLSLPLGTLLKARPPRGCETVGAGGLAGFLVLAILAGCAGAPVSEGPPEKIVGESAQARWNALIAGDVSAAYAYLSPASKQTYSLELYRNSIRPGFWQKVVVKEVKCEPEVCEVSLEVSYRFRGTPITTPLKETWIRSGGTWGYVFKG
jgi:hypothetical protein